MSVLQAAGDSRAKLELELELERAVVVAGELGHSVSDRGFDEVVRSEESTTPESDDPVSEQRSVGEAIQLSLRYRQALITLRVGTLYLGRSPDCELAISDPAVSRRHARLLVSPERVVIEDLASQNGVYVNGKRIHDPCPLEPGASFRICSHELELVDTLESQALEPNRYRITADTLSGADQSTLLEQVHATSHRPSSAPRPQLRCDAPAARLYDSIPPPREPAPSRPSSSPPSNDLLANGITALDEALNHGELSEAERCLDPILMRVHELLLAQHPSAHELAEHVVISAARLAGETRSAAFMNYAVTLYQLLNRPLPEPAVNVIHSLVQAGLYPNLVALESYVAKIGIFSADFDPTERFLLDSLRRVVSRSSR